jgi:hypothetical protein
MKKYIAIIGLAIAGVIHAQDAVTNDVSVVAPLPQIVVETKTIVSTNTITRVTPITLTDEQFAGIITMVQNSGISANVPITTENLRAVIVRKQPTGGWIVNIQVKQ